MRKVQMTKQQTVRPNEKMFGSTILISIVRVNGMSLIKHFIVCMKGPVYRPYQSKGAKYYEENDE